MSDTTTFVGTKAATGRLERLKARRGMTEAVRTIRSDMAEADRVYAESLATIRQAANLTQRALADAMGVNQSEVSRIEARTDLLLSTLANYLAAAGAEHTRVVLTLDGRDIELDLDALAGA
jgi:ribosome-binding protein aMBF1 (putative translation factor)